MTLTVAFGGVRSGKSAWAEREAARVAGRGGVLVLVSGEETDAAMAARIAAHRARRPAHWRALPLRRVDPASVDPVTDVLEQTPVALVDGIGAWLAQLLDEAGGFDEQADATSRLRAEQAALARARTVIDELARHAERPEHAVIVAAEEAGLGVLPAGAGSGLWLDLLGTVNQELAAVADRAVLVIGGRVVELPALGATDRLEPDPVLSLGAASAVALRTAKRPAADGNGQLAALRQHGDRLVSPGDQDHAVNVDAAGAPDWLLDVVAATSVDRAALGAYPDDTAAREALAARYGRLSEEIVPVAGAAQALWALAPAFGPQLAACIHPGFTEAEAGLRAHGVPVERVLLDPDRDFALDPAMVPESAELVVLSNPTAACGRLQPREAIEALMRPGRLIVIDEAFLDQVPGEPGSFLQDDADGAGAVVVVRSFTKSLAIAGLRAGVAVARPEVAARLRAALPPWPASAAALAAMVAIAGHPAELEQRAARVQDERDDLVRRLRAVPGLRVWPSLVNHVLCHHPRGQAAAAALRARGIVVRPCGSFPGLSDDHLRITARDRPTNARLADALEDVLR